MTYKESYKKYKTVEELRSEVKKDIATALLFNPDRVKFILEAGDDVAKENGWDLSEE